MQQGLHRLREQEDRLRVGDQLPQGSCTLDVHLDDDVPAFGEGIDDRALGHAVEVAVDKRALDEVTGLDLGLEVLAVDEEIMLSMDFAESHRARGRRHHVSGIGVDLSQLLDHGILADARRSGNDEDLWCSGVQDPGNVDVAMIAKRLDKCVTIQRRGGSCLGCGIVVLR